MTPEIVSQLAPSGTLKAAINLSNFLLVTGRSASGEPEGVAPDMARAIADRLGVGLQLVAYPTPGELSDAADSGVWDIGLIGAEPERAKKITFSSAYSEIEATYLVPPGSPLEHVSQVDRPGIRIATAARTAYGLWLERNIEHAELVQAEGFDATFELFVNDKLDALACLKSKLLSDAEKIPGSRILQGQFTAVQQAVGTAKGNVAGAKFLQDFVEEAKASGFVASLIQKHQVRGLSVAGPFTA
ncbi:MAG: ABC transporter substrate-binding protein [Burkholderiaceae bacterium]